MVQRLTKQNANTILLQLAPKQQATTNARWLHLGAGKTSILYTMKDDDMTSPSLPNIIAHADW
jgi:hypothetical protein